MDLDELRNLPTSELDRMAAEAQGWKETPRAKNMWMDQFGICTELQMSYVSGGGDDQNVWIPSADLNEAAEFEEFVIGKVGDAYYYFNALCHVWHDQNGRVAEMIDLIRAHAKTRVMACLLALEAQNG
jgi:hypothetical protein